MIGFLVGGIARFGRFGYLGMGLCPKNLNLHIRGRLSRRAQVRASNGQLRLSGNKQKRKGRGGRHGR